MKKILVMLTVLFAANFVFAGADDVLQFKAKIGFTKNEDKIIEHEFLDGGKKILIIGEKNIQIWDIESARLLSSVPHQIPQFASQGFISDVLLFGLPRLFLWHSYAIDEGGKWIITVEKVGDNPLRSAVVRDLETLKQIAIMDLPNVSTEKVAFVEQRNEILTFGTKDKNAAFARWDKDKFTAIETVSINEYKWHQMIRGEKKMLVGAGSTKVLWYRPNIKEGDQLTLRDVKTGAIEKEYTAKNLKPETAYQETTVSPDEKYLISKRDDRVFVWEIDGDGSPKFEISNPNPKGDFSFKKIYDGKLIVVKIDDQLRVYDVAGNGAPMIEAARQNLKEDLDFLDVIGGKYMIVKIDGKIRVYDAQGGKQAKLEIASDNPKDSMEFNDATKDGRFIAVRDDQKISVYDLTNGEKPLYTMFRRSEKERFHVVNFWDEKNFLVVSRVNQSEKKIPTTEFYEIATGKLVFDADFAGSSDMKFTPDGKYIYQTGLGIFSVWNIAARQLFWLPLKVYTPEYNPSAPSYMQESPRNREEVELSPDYRFVLKYGDDLTEVYEIETGKQVQALFDPEKVKYDKQNRVKKSGLGDAGWVGNGKYIYALEPVGLFREINTVSLWEVKK